LDKQDNTEQGEPGSYERLRKPLHAYSLSTLIQCKRRNTSWLSSCRSKCYC